MLLLNFFFYSYSYYIVRTTVKTPFIKMYAAGEKGWILKFIKTKPICSNELSSSTALSLQKKETDANGATGHFIPLRLCIHNNLINRTVLSSFYHDIPITLFLLLFPTITTFQTCSLFDKKKGYLAIRPCLLHSLKNLLQAAGFHLPHPSWWSIVCLCMHLTLQM